jgi:UDP-N-acetylglucosamine--dolichyl-phosphate N-acetylglucosaminephosphotransferase
MIDKLILIPLLVSFFVSLLFIPFWIRKANQLNLIWDDMNKFSGKKVAGSGGIIVILAFVIATLVFIAYRVLVLESSEYLIEIFALLSSVLILAAIGFVDDIFGWHHGGMSIRSRLILVFFASIPLIVINAGNSIVSIPFNSIVNLGLFYTLFLIPLGIIGATTTFNFLAGFNGLEAGQAILILSSFSLINFLTGNSILALICLIMIFALIPFLIYNFNPAKIFPGNVLTYPIGGLIAIICILGNFEKVAVFIFIPYILETILKLRGNLKMQSFGLPKSDGSLDLKYSKIYGLEHLSIYLMKKYNIKPTETKVVLSIWLFQIFLILLAFLIFREGIFNAVQ